MPKMTFIERDGTRRIVEAPIGLSVAMGLTGRVTEWAPDDSSGFKYQLRVGLDPLTTQFGSFNLFGQPRLGRVRGVCHRATSTGGR